MLSCGAAAAEEEAVGGGDGVTAREERCLRFETDQKCLRGTRRVWRRKRRAVDERRRRCMLLLGRRGGRGIAIIEKRAGYCF